MAYITQSRGFLDKSSAKFRNILELTPAGYRWKNKIHVEHQNCLKISVNFPKTILLSRKDNKLSGYLPK